jgi:hypothetical protein
MKTKNIEHKRIVERLILEIDTLIEDGGDTLDTENVTHIRQFIEKLVCAGYKQYNDYEKQSEEDKAEIAELLELNPININQNTEQSEN